MKHIIAAAILIAAAASAFSQSLGDALQYLYPNASQISGDFRVEDRGDGQGAKIARWDAAKLGAQPSQAQIDQAKIDLTTARTAASTTRQQESTVLAAALTKLGNGTDLTAAELRAVIAIIIRRQNVLQSQLIQTARN